jgi:hypothetical protein
VCWLLFLLVLLLIERGRTGLKDPSEAPFNDYVMEEYNTVFGQNVGTHDLWNEYVPKKLFDNFSVSPLDLPTDLHDYMRKINFKDRMSGESCGAVGVCSSFVAHCVLAGEKGKWYLMVRVNETAGIEIEPAVMEQLQSEPKMFERSEVLDYLDVIGLRERVKPLNIINQAKGEFYYLKGALPCLP